MSSNYYEHINDFDGFVPKDGLMPSDVKRLISHSKYEYKTRYYFVSPSERMLYRYYDSNDGSDCACRVCGRYVGKNKKSLKFNLMPDVNRGLDNIHDALIISDRFIKRIENMNKLILPSLR